MFHKAEELTFKEGTVLELAFQDGVVKRMDMAELFDDIPAMRALEDRELFLSGRLAGHFGIIWNDDVDLEAETVYQEGKTVRHRKVAPHLQLGEALYDARTRNGFSQAQLAKACGMDQADVSRIERGLANPSVGKLERLAAAMNTRLVVAFEDL